jgi:hypothetical protein
MRQPPGLFQSPLVCRDVAHPGLSPCPYSVFKLAVKNREYFQIAWSFLATAKKSEQLQKDL